MSNQKVGGPTMMPHDDPRRAHPDGYSEPPEPQVKVRCANCSVDLDPYSGLRHFCESGYSEPPSLNDPNNEHGHVGKWCPKCVEHGRSGEPGMERDREAAAKALMLALPPAWWTILSVGKVVEAELAHLDANPEAAATLAAYLRGASPQPKGLLDEAWKAAEAALPKGWGLALSSWKSMHDAYATAPDAGHDPYELAGNGPTPTAALQALTAALSKQGQSE